MCMGKGVVNTRCTPQVLIMKCCHFSFSSHRYHELDPKKSLKDNLMHKTIIEYPALLVTLKDHCQEYLTERQGKFADFENQLPLGYKQFTFRPFHVA